MDTWEEAKSSYERNYTLMDENNDNKVDWDEYWKWSLKDYQERGYKNYTVLRYKSSFFETFQKMAGDDGYLSMQEYIDRNSKFYIKDQAYLLSGVKYLSVLYMILFYWFWINVKYDIKMHMKNN